MKLAADVFGRGPALVLMPGWATPAAVLRPWAQRLATRWRVTLVELPGQGVSSEPWPELDRLPRQLADALPAGAIWLGWSLGGQLLLAAARHRAPAGLCLLSASPRFCAGPDWPHGVAPALLRAMREALPADPQRVLARFLGLLAGAGRDSRLAVRQLKQTVTEAPIDRAALAAGLAALAELDLREALPTLDVPTRWVSGGQDPLVPPEAVAWAAKQMPHARACMLPDAGHIPFLTHAAAVEAALADLRAQATGGE
jgi:pimeloyl-[acyl-carrier protein] methyl ester esterase